MTINDIPEAFSVTLRLKILSSLVVGAKTFNEILAVTDATKGNLSSQLLKLENWGYLISSKQIENRKTKTTYAITSFGLRQFEEYVELLQRVLNRSL